MKIVHYMFGLPPVRTGGLFRYALDLAAEQKKLGLEVILLLPGAIQSHGNKVAIHYWKKWNTLPCYRIKNPLYIPNGYGVIEPDAFMTPCDKRVYSDWLRKVQPDVIHMHSLMGIHTEFLDAANEENIPIIYTTHDYYGLCPKIDLMKGSQECNACDWSQCSACCFNAYSLKRLRLEQTTLYRMYCSSPFCMTAVHSRLLHNITFFRPTHSNVGTSLQPHAVLPEKVCAFNNLGLYYRRMFSKLDYFLFNSEQTKDVFIQKLGDLSGSVLPILNGAISDHRKKRTFAQTLRLGYLGSSTMQKGISQLIDTLLQLRQSGRTDFYLNTYMLEGIEHTFIRNHMPYDASHLSAVFDDMDLLIVPSIWKETFGMVVVEALSYGIPVLISENVGARMLVKAHPGTGLIFSSTGNELLHALITIYDKRSILTDMNTEILNATINFDFPHHVKDVLSFYSQEKDKKDHGR